MSNKDSQALTWLTLGSLWYSLASFGGAQDPFRDCESFKSEDQFLALPIQVLVADSCLMHVLSMIPSMSKL